MGRSKRKKGGCDIATPSTKVGVATPSTGGSRPKSAHHGDQLPTITRGPEALRQMQAGSPMQRTAGNEGVLLKVEFLSKIASWAAAAEIPSLGALYGSRLASTCQSAGIPSPVLDSQCERCESVLLPGINCSARVALPTKRKGKRGKGSTGDHVLYHCHFCKHRNKKPGSQNEHSTARSQMKHLASGSSSSLASPNPTTPVHGVMKSSAGGNSVTTPITPADSITRPFSAGVAFTANQSLGGSSSRNRKRKGWTGLKAMAAGVQNRELQTPERRGSVEDFTSPLNPRKKKNYNAR